MLVQRKVGQLSWQLALIKISHNNIWFSEWTATILYSLVHNVNKPIIVIIFIVPGQFLAACQVLLDAYSGFFVVLLVGLIHTTMQQLLTGHTSIYFVTTCCTRSLTQLNWDWSDNEMNWDGTRAELPLPRQVGEYQSKLGMLTDHVVSPRDNRMQEFMNIINIECQNSSRLIPTGTRVHMLGP